jgi:alanine racemase
MNKPLIRAEIDLAAIDSNLRLLREITNPHARILVAVKGDAYGHGMSAVARQALHSGADILGVARIDEAVMLRKAGIEAPVLVFGPTPPVFANELLNYDITTSVCSVATAQSLSVEALKKGSKIKVHAKIDTGMGRLGIMADSLGVPGHSPGKRQPGSKSHGIHCSLSRTGGGGDFYTFCICRQ